MSKKNKKRKVDYFDLTPEEQMANANMFHNVEKGEASFLDALNYKVPTAPIAQSDYTRQIERACLGIKETDEETSYFAEVDNVISDASRSNNHSTTDDDNTIPYTYTDSHEDKPDVNVYINENDTDEDKITDDGLSRVHFHYEPIVGKMIITDGLVSTPVSVCHTSAIDINQELIPDDDDALGHMLSKIFFYIISCKHPAVIVSEDAFEIECSMYAMININRFIFFKNNGFVYAYIIEEDERDAFYSVMDIFNMNNEELLRYVIGAAYAVSNVNSIFQYNDEDEVESLMEARHDIKGLIKLIDEDPETQYAGHNATRSVMNRLGVVNLQKTVEDVRGLLDNLTDEIDDDDDDEDDYIEDIESDDEDDDDDIDVTDFPDIDMATNTDDIDDMLECIEPTESVISMTKTTSTETVEAVVGIEKVEATDSDDDMVLPVIHRRQ